jgi:hypothetical protein
VITAENFWFWFGGIWLAAGVVLAAVGGGVGVSRAMPGARLEAEGASADGVVLTKSVRAPNDGAETHSVTFRFAVAQGETVVGRAELEPQAWDAQAIVAFVLPLAGAVVAALGGFVLWNARRTRRAVRAT